MSLYRKEAIEIEMFWNDLMLRLAKSGIMSYKELKTLEVHEFFVMLVNYEKQLKEAADGQSKLRDTE